MKNKKQC